MTKNLRSHCFLSLNKTQRNLYLKGKMLASSPPLGNVNESISVRDSKSPSIDIIERTVPRQSRKRSSHLREVGAVRPGNKVGTDPAGALACGRVGGQDHRPLAVDGAGAQGAVALDALAVFHARSESK